LQGQFLPSTPHKHVPSVYLGLWMACCRARTSQDLERTDFCQGSSIVVWNAINPDDIFSKHHNAARGSICAPSYARPKAVRTLCHRPPNSFSLAAPQVLCPRERRKIRCHQPSQEEHASMCGAPLLLFPLGCGPQHHHELLRLV